MIILFDEDLNDKRIEKIEERVKNLEIALVKCCDVITKLHDNNCSFRKLSYKSKT